MKFKKRILATVLTLALALGLALPTMAAVDWDEFKITRQPQGLTIKHGDSFTLSVEVTVPVDVEVEYQWRSGSDARTIIEGATDPDLHLGSNAPNYPPNDKRGGSTVTYSCKITAYEKDDSDNVIASQVLFSDRVRVTTERTLGGKLYDITLAPFEEAAMSAMMALGMSWGLLIPFVPIVFLGVLIYSFIKNFIALF